MKRFFLVFAVLLLISTVAHAQQPSSAEIRQSAQQFLTQGRENSSHFESVLADLTASNVSNRDAVTYNRLRTEIERLETSIATEEARLKASLDVGQRVTQEMLNRVERLINQHRAKLEELQVFISRGN